MKMDKAGSRGVSFGGVVMESVVVAGNKKKFIQQVKSRERRRKRISLSHFKKNLIWSISRLGKHKTEKEGDETRKETEEKRKTAKRKIIVVAVKNFVEKSLKPFVRITKVEFLFLKSTTIELVCNNFI